ncbi:MAG: tRNA (adenosine(37)-N6)-threonylcarbamoyltransferase complex transferase subunit TsaD [Firmicutes bacterium]|nr:tRNA (adenosine(37)-N6)-threonylcarbamoyltransferase complex transferase subunit TsaD [Bacillota bacterium]
MENIRVQTDGIAKPGRGKRAVGTARDGISPEAEAARENPGAPGRRAALILGIETSCDETAAAVVGNGAEVLSNVIASQVGIHSVYGGVVPEIASRRHIETICSVADEAMLASGAAPGDLAGIAVTCGPGLEGALLVGVSFAKSLAFAWGLPLIGVNHIEGHICANFLTDGDLEGKRFLCLVVSGGHTHLVLAEKENSVSGPMRVRVLGRTRDDAAGEAFDKIARALGLGYPGGPAVERAAKDGDAAAFAFPKARVDGGIYDFSFSGLKSAVLNTINKIKTAGGEPPVSDLAASFQKAVVEALVEKTMAAAAETGAKEIALAGGVASNGALRAAMADVCEKRGLGFHVPPPVFCTDNAAMIASCGYFHYLEGRFSGPDLNAEPNLAL